MTSAIPRPNIPVSLESASLKRWTVADYHLMSEVGILRGQERTELLAGQITLMAAQATPHVTALQLLANVLRTQLGEAALVRTQDPIQLDDFSEPEPDLVIAKGMVLDYAIQHPRPEQIELVVEVADSTLKQDCEVKAVLYAQAGIADYWVLDLQNRQIHVFREPTAAGYTRRLILTEPNQIAPLAFPNLVLSLDSILPPVV